MALDIAPLGASELRNGVLVVQSKVPIDAGTPEDGPEDYGQIDVISSLGVTARPAPANENGAAEGVVADGIGGVEGVLLGARDRRSIAKVLGELGPGETCLHSTGEDFDSRIFCKDQSVAIVVGDDLAFVLDRKNKKVSLAAFGHMFELSEENGVSLYDKSGTCGIHMENGEGHLMGNWTLGGKQGSAVTTLVVGTPGVGQAPAIGITYGVG